MSDFMHKPTMAKGPRLNLSGVLANTDLVSSAEAALIYLDGTREVIPNDADIALVGNHLRFEVTFTVKNKGPRPTEAFVVTRLIARNGAKIVSPPGEKIGLAPGDEKIWVSKVDPDEMAHGMWVATVAADVGDLVDERREDNNLATTSWRYTQIPK